MLVKGYGAVHGDEGMETPLVPGLDHRNYKASIPPATVQKGGTPMAQEDGAARPLTVDGMNDGRVTLLLRGRKARNLTCFGSKCKLEGYRIGPLNETDSVSSSNHNAGFTSDLCTAMYT